MPRFRRTDEPPRERTPEERERARAERAARRAAERGEPLPPQAADFTGAHLDDPPHANGHAAEEPVAEAPPAEDPVAAQPPPTVDEPAFAAEPPPAADEPAFAAEPPAAAAEPAFAADPPAPVDAPDEPRFRAEPPEAEQPVASEPLPPEDVGHGGSVSAFGGAPAEATDAAGEPPFAGHPAEHGFADAHGERAEDDWLSDDKAFDHPVTEQPAARADEPSASQPTEHFDALAGDEPAPVPSARGDDPLQPTAPFRALHDDDADEAGPEDPEAFDEEHREAQGGGIWAAPSDTAAGAPVPPAARRRPGGAPAARFDDEGERPAPVKRVSANERRKLPPTPPPPGAPAHTKRRRRRMRIAGLVGLILFAALAFLVNMVFQPFHGDGGKKITVRVPSNSTAADVGDVLAEKQIVDSGFLFMVRARLSGAELQAGSYSLPRDISYSDAIDALSKGPEAAPTVNVAIPEGRSRREAAPLVKEAGLTGSYEKASRTAPKGFNPRRYGAPKRLESLEGFLFPATYELKPRSSSRRLVAKQIDTFEQNIGKVDMKRARARNLTTYDVLVIASMVERESTLAKERPLVSAVIHNRLRTGEPLGIDATIRFATRNWTQPLKQSELETDSPYNTRLNAGLPPGPIGSPGLDSIRAAANPAKVDHRYYVVKPGTCGEHNFSSTQEEFERDKAEYDRARAERGGKSPDTC